MPEKGWFSIVELIAAIVQTRDSEMALNLHPDVVESILGTSDISEVPPEFFLLYDILEPLYILSKNLENQRTRLCQAIPLIRTCMDRWKEVFRTNLSATFIVILGKLLSNLLARLRSNAFEEMVTSYILSIPGKREIASRLNCFSNDRCRASAVQELLLAMQQCPESFEIDRQEVDEAEQWTTSDELESPTKPSFSYRTTVLQCTYGKECYNDVDVLGMGSDLHVIRVPISSFRVIIPLPQTHQINLKLETFPICCISVVIIN